MRPPGRRTLAISANTAGLSAARLMTQLLMTTSTEASGKGSASIVPFRKSTLAAFASRALRRDSSIISSVMSTPIARPVVPTRAAESRTSMPPPDPRSSTVSPGLSSATAVGLPHPRLARTAPSGSEPRSARSYRSGPKAVVSPPAQPQPEAGPQQEPSAGDPPAWPRTDRAAPR